MRWLFGYDCSTFSSIGLFCCVDDKDAASTVGFCCRYGEKTSIAHPVPKITVATAEQPRTTLHPPMVAAPLQHIASLSVPTTTSPRRIKPEMESLQFMSIPPMLTATLRVNSTATSQGVTTPRLGSTFQQPVAQPSTRRQLSNRQQQSFYEQPCEVAIQRQLLSRQQPSSYDLLPSQRQPSTRQQVPSYDLPPTQRRILHRQQPSSQGLLVSPQPLTNPEHIVALELKLEAYRQIIVDLVKPVASQQEPAVSVEQLKTSLRKAVSNPQPRTTATPYPDAPYPPSPKLEVPSQSQHNPERFELPATNLQQSKPPPRTITTPPSVDTNPYRNNGSKLSAPTNNLHRTVSQPQTERPQWPSTPILSDASSQILSSKEVLERRHDCRGIPVPPGCCILDRGAILHGLKLMAQYLHYNNADLTIIAVGGVVSTILLRAWFTTTEVNALGSTLTPAQRQFLASAVSYAKTNSPIPLGDGWFGGLGAQDIRPDVARDVYALSVEQNDVLFSSEGLTVLAPRWSYAIMVCVDRLSRGVARPYDIGDAVVYLHQYIKVGKHKLIPIMGIMNWGQGYDLQVTLKVLRFIKVQYLKHYEREAISE